VLLAAVWLRRLRKWRKDTTPRLERGHSAMELSRHWIELAAQGVETLAVAIMVSFILIGTLGWLFQTAKNVEGSYDRYRIVLGKALLVGLELLVAADIINTVAFALTVNNLALLAGLVIVRTALGWTVTVEVEGHWPWQQTNESRIGSDREARQASDPYGERSTRAGLER
jgi:uncharacterized membrane protein